LPRRSFVAGATGPRRYAAIIHSIMGLVQNLGIDVIAEGVETMEQVALLQALGCSRGQGYLFSQPINTDAMGDLIRTGPRTWLPSQSAA